VRRLLLFLPSLALGVLGGAWTALHPWPYSPHLGIALQLVVGVLTGALLLSAAWLLERTVPSFRYASTLMENALRSVRLPPWTALLLAAATAGSEELFFRGSLLPLLGLLPQALLFGLFHPVPRRAWAYPVFAAVAGLVFGELTLATGSLLPALVAHFVVNLQGLWEVRRQPAHRQGPDPGAEPGAEPGSEPGSEPAPYPGAFPGVGFGDATITPAEGDDALDEDEAPDRGSGSGASGEAPQRPGTRRER